LLLKSRENEVTIGPASIVAVTRSLSNGYYMVLGAPGQFVSKREGVIVPAVVWPMPDDREPVEHNTTAYAQVVHVPKSMVLVINVFYGTVVGYDVKLRAEFVVLAQINLEGPVSAAQIKRQIKLHTGLFVVVPARGSVEALVIHGDETLISKLADPQHG
jgi:hypothetical protein